MSWSFMLDAWDASVSRRNDGRIDVVLVHQNALAMPIRSRLSTAASSWASNWAPPSERQQAGHRCHRPDRAGRERHHDQQGHPDTEAQPRRLHGDRETRPPLMGDFKSTRTDCGPIHAVSTPSGLPTLEGRWMRLPQNSSTGWATRGSGKEGTPTSGDVGLSRATPAGAATGATHAGRRSALRATGVSQATPTAA